MQVVELAQEMTVPMVAIYDAIVSLLDACIKELRRSNKIDSSDFTLEECLFRSFDEAVRRQLDAVWHTVSPKTKQVPPAWTEGCMAFRLPGLRCAPSFLEDAHFEVASMQAAELSASRFCCACADSK
jgi:hypothetical protein